MKIGIVGANGNAGKLIAEEAVKRGYEVTAIVRGKNESQAQNTKSKPVEDLTKEDLTQFDVVVDAFGAWTPETIGGIGDAIISLADKIEGSNTRLIVVGGAGSLFVNPEHTQTVDMGPEVQMTGSRSQNHTAEVYLICAKPAT